MGVLFCYFVDGLRNINCHNSGEKANGNFIQLDSFVFPPTVMSVDYLLLVRESQEVHFDSPTLQMFWIVHGALCMYLLHLFP